MEIGKTKSLYYKRVIWLKNKLEPKEPIELLLNILKNNTYIHKGLDIVVNIEELVDLRHTKTVYEYFEHLKDKDQQHLKTLCILNFENFELLQRDFLLAKVTKMWTSYSTAYINCKDLDYIRSKNNRVFTYILGNNKVIENLTSIVQTGKYDETTIS